MNKNSELIITSDRTRSQVKNKDDCVDKLYDIILRAAQVPKGPDEETLERIEKLSNYQVGVNANSDDECSACWKAERNKIPECKKIPKSEIKLYESKTDYDLARNKEKCPNLVNCLCILSELKKTNEILKKCECSEEMSDGIRKESKLVTAQICTNPKTVKYIYVDDSTNQSNSSNSPSSSKSNSGTTIENSWIFGITLGLMALVFNF
ncbi:4309_t:CDS:2 [Diversispora eburnea]|uniref:4309_t:CDS:1 n=1 Tax=Diversispora eburnea TaxID=1213867 RepID=A0A9N8VU99_9GLOM|nr:4309_t:CDS:2 [Diversispora eburnea]